MVESNTSKKYDYIVIGAGVGGLASAKRAAKFNAKVLLIENREIGGASFNWGSLPKKIMWSLAAHLTEGRAVQSYGLQSDPKLDFAKF